MDLKLFGRQFLSPVATDLFDLEYLWFKYLNSAYSKGHQRCFQLLFVLLRANKTLHRNYFASSTLVSIENNNEVDFFPLKYLFQYFIVLSYGKKYKYLSRTKYWFRISKVEIRARKHTTLSQIKKKRFRWKGKSRKEKSTSHA